MMMNIDNITISIVSHGHASEITNLLLDIDKYCKDICNVIITLNIPENIPSSWHDFSFPMQYIHNQKAKGYGHNHNSAFEACRTKYFCILNPDIRLLQNPFLQLLKHFSSEKNSIAAPQIIDQHDLIQDSARKFPTPWKILKRVLHNKRLSDYKDTKNPVINPDWVAGMFMLIPSEIYKKINGFDEKYFLYCEDVDLCFRLHQAGYSIIYDTTIKAIHNAHRDSHRKLKYTIWHIQSLLRFFRKYYFTH